MQEFVERVPYARPLATFNRASARTDWGSLRATTSPTRGPCAGPFSGTTRIPSGTSNMCSQACEITLDQRPPGSSV